MTQFSDWQVGKGTKNAVINGDMRIAQRGTSFVAIANNAYSLDRWQYFKVGTAVHTVSQVNKTAASANTPSDQYEYAMKFDCTTADASVAAGDYVILQHKVEGHNFRKFVGQTATVSFWVKAGKTGTMCVAFYNSAGDRSYVSEVTINSANTWEQKTVTLNFDYSGGTWDYGTGIGLRVTFTLMAGSTFHTTADAWQNGAYFATSNQTNFVDNTDSTCDVYITGVQLELGSQATDFEFMDYQKQLDQCYRYYWAFAPGGSVGLATGTMWTGTYNWYGPIRFPVEMRSNPTLSWSTALKCWDNTGNWRTITNVELHNPSGTQSASIQCDASGGTWTINQSTPLFTSDATGALRFDAEL
jgi:hypothetical protein